MVAQAREPQKWTIFLSHSGVDTEFASWLYSKLISANLTVWYDEYELLIGDSIIHRIEVGLTSSTFVVVVLSKAAISSNWVKAELEPKILQQIEGDSITVLPVVIDDVDIGKSSPFLKGKKFIRFPPQGSDETFRELLRSIEGHLERQGIGKAAQSESQPAPQNPFGLRGGVEPDRFIIPESLIEEITEDIAKKQAVSIIGARMLGKTSLLKFLASDRCATFYKDEDDRHLKLTFVKIDFQEHAGKTCDQMFSEIAYRMSADAEAELQGADRTNTIKWIKRKVGKYEKGEPLWVIEFDEFDHVVNLKGLDKIFFDELRALPADSNLSYVIASRKKLIDLPLPQNSTTSYFFNIFNEHFLTVWDDETSRRLAFEPRGTKLKVLTTGDFEFVSRLTARHPALLQMGCYYLFNFRRKTGVKNIDYALVHERYSERAESTYRYYLENEIQEIDRAWLHDCWNAMKSEDKSLLKELETNNPQRVNSTIRQGLAKLGLVLDKSGPINLPSGFESFLDQKYAGVTNNKNETSRTETNEKPIKQPKNRNCEKRALLFDEIQGKVDFAIITIREDEFKAVLARLDDRQVLRKSNRYYSVSRIAAMHDASYLVAAVRCSEQGTGEAQTVAQNIIKDLDPHWILVVGIAGGVPSNEFSLGDVVLSTRINDFTVSAVFENAPPAYSISGGPNKRVVADLVAFLPALDESLTGWNTSESISLKRPEVRVPPRSGSLYGNPAWQKKVRESLAANFAANAARQPLVTSGPIDSSDVLVKDTKTLNRWLRLTRNAVAVEMESAGIYRAARSGEKEYPFLAIRGISDIVGLKRDSKWTTYACHTAAAFALGLIRAGVIDCQNQ